MGNKNRLSIAVVQTTCGSQEARLFEAHNGNGEAVYSWVAGTIRPHFAPKAIANGEIKADSREAAIKQFQDHLQMVNVIPSMARTHTAGAYVSPSLQQIVPRVTDRNHPFAARIGHAVLARPIPVTANSLRAMETVA